MEEVNLVYYGHVFDASGYGQAARAYVHALHDAGVGLSVVNLSNSGRQVQDPLIESLLGRPVDPDFHLFHGIPPQWARLAFRLRNAIGMTVWETDTMPSQWRNILNHTLEVWLPCEFNVAVFGGALETPAFKLPHPVFPYRCKDDAAEEHRRKFHAAESNVVFYSIFEWQDRKCPGGTIESFLRAFPTEAEPLLIIKTNPSAAAVAHQTLEELRRRTNSAGRVRIHAEAWDESEIDALHERGNCYVSLHRGEGWCYPLFEAAARGTPVIATEYSGPTEYLSPQAHRMVRFTLGPVGQRYAYYHPNMRWAEPDLEHASQLMREVFEQPDRAREQATAASTVIKGAFSLESVGRVARGRLLQLLRRTHPAKWQRIGRAQIANVQSSAPVEPEWYDQDYFETGLKSNWGQGYSWTQFGGLFRDTAAYLIDCFSEAESFLDAGCAKGFLVRALREAGKECWGLDHSTWAIEHAEPSIKQFLFETGVDKATFDRQFDVLVAQSLFESLTEDQAFSFLKHARGWTRQAMLAIIACSDDNEDQTADYDISHITMRPRRWWHELITRAGWRQDHLHRVVERACQTHPLPAKMAWKVFVYSPGW